MGSCHKVKRSINKEYYLQVQRRLQENARICGGTIRGFCVVNNVPAYTLLFVRELLAKTQHCVTDGPSLHIIRQTRTRVTFSVRQKIRGTLKGRRLSLNPSRGLYKYIRVRRNIYP